MLLEDFSTNTPSRRTDSGRRDSTIFRRFCTSTAAMSGSVPCWKVTAISTMPLESLVADMYSRPGAAVDFLLNDGGDGLLRNLAEAPG